MKKLLASFLRSVFAALPFSMLLAVIAFVLFSNPVYDSTVSKKIVVREGNADFRLNPAGINELQGDWGFVWKRYVSAAEVRGNPALVSRFARLPGAWENVDGTERFGYASYVLEATGLDPSRVYAVRIGHTLSAYRVFINDEYVSVVGRPGVSRESEAPYWNAVNARFTPRPDGSATVILHISNFHDRCGGSLFPIYVGDAALIGRMSDAQHLTDASSFAVLVIMGLFFLALFAFHRSDRYFLWFALICIPVGFRSLCYNGFTLLALVPDLPWWLNFRLGYLTFPAFMIAFVAFFRSIYPGLVHRTALLVTAAVFGLFSAIVLFAPEFVSAIILPYFQMFAASVVLYGLVVIVIAVIRRMESSVWLLAGFSVAAFTFTYDTLVSMWIMSAAYIGPLGMGLCLFSLGLMVIARYSESFRRVREMSDELAIINRSLKRFVPSEFLSYLNKNSIIDIKPGDCVETDMAILSADIRSFTTISERMQPNEVFEFLNEYLRIVGPIIRGNGGFIAKYEGDGFMALFPDGAEAAVRCAVQMQSAIASRNRESPGLPPVSVGIGIDAGSLALGTVGDDSRIDGTVVSSCVRNAGQFEAATKLFQARILVNGSVFLGLTDPLAWFLRPVDQCEIDDIRSFLFEIYNNDQDLLRDLKWRTQSDLEHAVYAYFAGQIQESRVFLARVLSAFPDDPVANHYLRRLEA
jgi:class 3 adenylate cyclase